MTSHPDHRFTTSCSADERTLWMPPGRLKRYVVAKAVGAVLFAALFAGWWMIQGSNLLMRWLAAGLIVLTGWVTISSVVEDYRRARGRQLRVGSGGLEVVTPAGGSVVPIARIARGVWREDDAEHAGLWLFDEQDQVLAHLDTNFIADQSEARAFLGWARKQADFRFPIDWPTPGSDV